MYKVITKVDGQNKNQLEFAHLKDATREFLMRRAEGIENEHVLLDHNWNPISREVYKNHITSVMLEAQKVLEAVRLDAQIQHRIQDAEVRRIETINLLTEKVKKEKPTNNELYEMKRFIEQQLALEWEQVQDLTNDMVFKLMEDLYEGGSIEFRLKLIRDAGGKN